MIRRILSLLLVILSLFTSLITPSMAFALEASTDEAVIEEPTMESNVIKQEEKPEEKPAVDTNGTSKGVETQPTEDPKGTQPTDNSVPAQTNDDKNTNTEVFQESVRPGASILSIITPPVATHTYTFVSEGKTIESQIIKNGESLIEPEAPSITNKKFVGWYIEPPTDTTPGVKAQFDTPITVTSTQEITVTAVYKEVVYIYFWHDDTNDGISNFTVISTKEIIPGNKTDGSNVPVVTWPGKVFSHWSLTEGGPAFDFENTPITENTNLYSVLDNKWTVDFDSEGGSTVPLQNVTDGQYATAPTAPTKAGYTFSHWSTTPNGPAFNFSTTPIEADTTLYAVWTTTQAKYTVVYWIQNPNDDGYSIVKVQDMTGSTGNDATYTPLDNTFETSFSSKYKINQTKTDASKVKIAGDGSTVRNVYYDRQVYTLKIEYLPRGLAQLPRNWYTVSTTQFKYGQKTDSAYYSAMNQLPGYLWHVSRLSPTAYGEAPDMPNGNLTISGKYAGNYKYITHYREKVGTSEVTIHPDFIYSAESGRFYTIEDGIAIKGFTVVTPVTSWKQLTWSDTQNAYVGTIYYTRNKYNISFQKNDGTAATTVSGIPYEADISTKSLAEYEAGQTTMVRDGVTYTFAGWYDNKALVGDPYNFSGKKMPAEDLLLYAKWTAPVYNVNFHETMQITSAITETQEVNRLGTATDIGLPKTIPPGATEADFRGWYLFYEGNLVKYDFESPVIQDVDLFPVWGNITFKVTYDLNGGQGSVIDSSVYEFSSYAYIKPITGVTPPEGKVFLGWEKEDGTLIHPGDKVQILGDVKLKAVWGPAPTDTQITYDPNGGVGSTIVIPLVNNGIHTVNDNTFTREGYVFRGWNTNPDGSGIPFKSKDQILVDRINENTNVLYAQWEALIDLTSVKSWNAPAGYNYPDIWFTLIRVNKDGSETTIETKQVPNTSPYEVLWQGLERTDGTGYTYIYKVKETDASGTDFTPLNFKKIENGLNVTNNFVPISITGTKVWSENSPEVKPTIIFKLQQSTDGVNFTDYGVNGTPRTIVNGSTTAIWEDLPEFYAPGQKYIYKVIEDNPPESYTVEQTDNLTITNTFVDTTYTVTKVWDYGESGTPPEGETVRPPIQLQLYQDGKPYGSYVQVENQTALTYEHTWEGLPKYKQDGTEHIYTARELAIPDHYQMTWDAATNTITNTYREDSFTASKIWVGEQPAVGTVVKVQLYQLIKPDDPNYDANYKVAIGDPVTLVGPDWAHTWQGLSINGTHNGELVNFEYTIEEVAPFPDEYYYDAVSSASTQVTNVSETTSFTAIKTWINGPIAHPQVTLYLERKQEGQSDSEFTKVDGSDYTLSPSETRHTWSGLESYAQWSDTDKTQRIKWVYRVREVPVENYTTTYPDNQSVVNNYVPPSDGTATATKIWSGGKPEDHVRPSFTLWRRMPGGLIEVVPETEFTLEVTPSDPQATSTEFVFTWTGLQTKDEHGDEIQYGFQENPVPNGYSLSFTGQSYTDPETGATWGYSGSTAQNTYIVPKNTTFTANKTWVNGPTKDHNQVYLQLWRTIDVNDSTKLEKVAADVHPTVVFDEATQTYAYTWENLESTDNDANPYTYFFTEEVVPGYTRTYSSSQMFDGTEYGVDGSTVTNEYVIPTDGKAEATKKFVNGSPDTHIAPTMTLWRQLSDGTLEKVEATAVITGTAPTFYYSWTGLERTDSNGYEYEFYFTEDNVPVNYELTYTSTLEKDGKLYGYNGAIAENKYKSPSREVTAYKQWVNGSATDYYAVPLKLWRTTNPGVGPVEEVIANYSVTESTTPGRYEYVWTNLPENDDQGKPYIYYFTESEQDNYKREYSSPSTIDSIEYGLTGADQGVSNTFVSPKGTIIGDKEWVFGNQDLRPEVFMKLYRSINIDGSGLEEVPDINPISLEDATYTPDPNGRSYLTDFSWDNIDLKAPNGQSYHFFVKEVDASGADYTPEHYLKYENRQSVINVYQATGTLTPKVTKILNGRSLKEGEFTFQLIELTDSTDENGDLVTTETVIGTTANTADGLVKFEALSFDQTDIDKTKTYIIREVKPDPVEEGMVYGDDISLVVSITDPGNNDGTLTITPSYSSEQQVVNTYTATGTFTPAPTKVLDGRILTDGEFTFNLLDVDGTVLQTKANKADGTIPFEAIAYTQEDIGKTFTYTVKEVIPDPTESGMAYDPMEITYTVEVTDGGNGVLTITPVLPEDTEFNNIFTPNPSFKVDKSADKDSFKTAGETIIYTITVENTGNVPIDNLKVEDSKFDLTEATLAGDTNSNTILDVDEVWTYTYTYTTTQADVDAGKIENVVTVTDPDDPDNPGEDTEIVPTTSFTVTKSANKDSFKTAGEEIVYTITITNTGNGPIDKLEVSDSKFDLTEATLAGDTNSNTILDVDEVWTYTYTYTTTQADVDAGKIENVVTVTDPDDPDNPGEDTEIVPTTSFTVTKSANKDSFKTAGEEIVYTITITNTGNGPIDKLEVSDSKFDLTEATLAGDTNSNTILDVDEVWTYTYTYTTTQADVDAGKIENVVTVTDPDDPDNPGEDTEIVPTTSFTVTKSANKDSFKTAGEEIVYTIRITNTGNGPIDKLEVSDSKFDLTEATLAGDTNSNTILDVDEVWTYTYTYTTTQADVDAGKIENVVTVTDPDDPDNPGEDTEIVPTTSFTVTKSANKDSFKTAGEEIVYTITITNTGNGPIDKLEVSDSKFDLTEATLAGDTNSNTILDVGEVWTYTYTYTTTDADVEAGKIENVVTVTDPDDPDNPGEDTEIVPTTSFTVTKSANKDSFKTAGEEIVYTITITNTGNGPIDKLEVSDSKFDLTEATLAGDTNSNTILDVGEVWTYTYTYTTTDADVEAGKIENVVTVTDPDDPDNPGEDKTTTNSEKLPAMTVVKTAGKTSYSVLGEEVPYTVVVTNTGNITLKDLTVTDSLVNLENEATLVESVKTDGMLQVGETWTYTYKYRVTQADLDKGSIYNLVTVKSPDPDVPPVEDDEEIEKLVTKNDTPSISISKIAKEKSFKKVGDKLTYSVVIKNTGNVDITSLTVIDSLVDLSKIAPVESITSDKILQVGETWTYNYTYVVTEADEKAGKVVNKVTAKSPQLPNEPSVSHTIPKEPSVPPMKLPKTGSGSNELVLLGGALLIIGLGFLTLRKKIKTML